MDRFKKRIFMLIVIGYVLVLFFPIHIIYANSENVIDYVGFLSDSEIEQLQIEIQKIQESYRMDAVIVITDDTEGKSSQAFADDYFDYNGYGIGDDYDGILLLVNMQDRMLHISTTGGQTIDQYQPYIDSMIDRITPHLSNGEYYQAGLVFTQLIYSIESDASVNDVPIEKTSIVARIVYMATSPLPYIVGIVLASIITAIITLSSKGKVTVTNRTYEVAESFILERQTDRFIRESVHRVKVETNSSSGGTHTGSSGRSHGGGGGRF